MLFVVFLLYFGVFVYLVVRGGRMQERQVQTARAYDASFRNYVDARVIGV
jgi:hypothetical protein